MKHLKLFEDNTWVENKYFKRLTYTELRDEIRCWDIDFIDNNWIDFTEREIKRIMKLFPDSKNKRHTWIYDSEYTAYAQHIKASIEIREINITNSDDPRFPPTESKPRIIYGIIKLKDSWFYVRNYGTAEIFKCDQFDAVLEYLW